MNCSNRLGPLRATALTYPALLGLMAALAGCGSSGLEEATAVAPTAGSSTPAASAITTLTPAQVVRASVGLTDLAFIRYDIAAGLSYSYGFSIGNYDGTGKPAISYFDSYVAGRTRLRTQTGAIGHVMYNDGENDIIYPSETFPGLTSNAAEFLLEREVAIDVNGDGKLDIAGVSNSHSAVVAYINPGTRNVPWGRRVLSSATPAPVNLTVADVNGDGLPDIIVSMRYQPTTNPAAGQTVGLAWLENTGKPTGEWIYHTIDTTPGTFQDPRTVQAADINGDGKIDVVTTDGVTGTVAWYEQVTPTNWVRHVIPGVSTINAHFGRVVDVDGDGSPDIVLPVTAGVSWLRNVNNGASWEVHPVVQFTDTNWTNIVTETVPGDIHHDGSLDIVFSVGQILGGTSTVRSGGVYIAHSSGSAWTVSRVYQTEDNVCCLDLIDFDSTGVLSIVSNAEYQQNGITVWQNQLGLP
jgi:FG-GAP-like repeat